MKLTNGLSKATSLDNLNVQKFEQHEKINKQTNNTQTIVSKVFETQETDLKSKDMYPMRVNSKIPNPKIIRPQTVPSKLVTDNFVPNYINNNNNNTNYLPNSSQHQSITSNLNNIVQQQNNDSHLINKLQELICTLIQVSKYLKLM